MPHLDPDLLALLALGGRTPSAGEREHLDSCPACRAEEARLARTVAAARLGSGAPLERPGPAVWAGIAAELDLPARLRRDPLLPARRFPRRALTATVAAVVLVAGIGAGVLLLRPTPVLATATLRAFPAWPGQSGSAVVERAPDGREVVRITTSVRPDGRTDHEVWLMTAGAKQLVSLGYLRGADGVFTVPRGVDLDRYRLIDVSDEPRDGDPAHSGNSIIRGTFRA